MRHIKDFKQIMRADGWRAIYVEDDGAIRAYPLVGWAIAENAFLESTGEWREDDAERDVVPLVCDRDGSVHSATEDANFVGIISPDESIDLPWVKTLAAERLAEICKGMRRAS